LNRYPKLRNVLHNQLKQYDNVEVEWVPGKSPTGYLYDADGTEIKNFELGDKSLDELLQLFSENGFTPSISVATYPQEPTASVSYGGHHYEVFNVPNFFKTSDEHARGRTHEGLRGYTVTISSAGENAFVSELLRTHGVEKAWLGAQDEEEGKWKWIGENGQVFWNGAANGVAEGGAFANWHPGEPNDVNDEDCAFMYAMDGFWNDGSCLAERAALVVEYGDAPLVEPAASEQKPDL